MLTIRKYVKIMEGLSLIRITYKHSLDGSTYATIHTYKSRRLVNVYE